jgi:hypothetical protein
MLGCRAMSSPEPELPEPRARCCPFCGSDQIALRRRGPDGAGMTKVEQWCTACEREFFGSYKDLNLSANSSRPLPWGPNDIDRVARETQERR